MGRFGLALAASFYLVSAASGQTPAGSPAASTPEARPIRERWRNMSPEERQEFKANMQRWIKLAPEERQKLRFREDFRRERMRAEIDDAMRAAGLLLEGEQRQQFQRAYLQERRRIDRALRQEMQERREKELLPVIERLKQQFSQPAPAASPAK